MAENSRIKNLEPLAHVCPSCEGNLYKRYVPINWEGRSHYRNCPHCSVKFNVEHDYCGRPFFTVFEDGKEPCPKCNSQNTEIEIWHDCKTLTCLDCWYEVDSFYEGEG